jgi:peptide/nickel transport system substrate-binding protein
MGSRAPIASILLMCLACAVQAAHLRWSSQSDVVTLDPHAFNESFTTQQNGLFYDFLIGRDKDYQIIPGLAASWERLNATTWIVRVRQGVRFQDGSPLTAADVVFSFQRASRPESGFQTFARQAGSPRQMDEYTVEFTTPVPDPLFPETMGSIAIMSRAWCEKHQVTKPQDFRSKERTHASANAMGTGAFILVNHEPGVRMSYRKNPDWWGIREGLYDGNVDTVEYRPIANAGTRMAALHSGEVDFVLDPPVQDVPRLRGDKSLKVWEGQELRVLYVGMDLGREELLYSDVKGRNPFKDVRVRKAMMHAIDIEALRTQVMRGMAKPTGLMMQDPGLAGLPAELDQRPKYDEAAARRLLAEAGYPAGFAFTLDCPNDRYVNDSRICSALATMWARIGISVRVHAAPRAQYFPKVLKRDTSAFLLGIGGGSTDPVFILKLALHSRDESGRGGWNVGDLRNERLDAVIVALESEFDAERRRQLTREAMLIIREEVLVLPLHRQFVTWVSRANVTVVVRPNNALVVPWVKIH